MMTGAPDLPSAAAALEARPGEPLVIRGANFSGRTAVLRHLAGLGEDRIIRADSSAYVGPEIYNTLSGLALTVSDEIILHAQSSRIELPVGHLVKEIGLEPLLDRNPFSLSGGEQALAALTAVFAFQPTTLALDCCLEQLDSELRERMLSRLVSGLGATGAVALADNRLDEYPLIPAREVRMQIPREPGERGRPRLSQISLSGAPGPGQLAATLEIEGLTFRYRGARSLVLRGLSVTLEPGRPYLLEGRNGSGKSTLAKILCGSLRPTAGAIRHDGKCFQPWRQPGRVVAYHFQNPDLQLFSTRVAEEVEVGARQTQKTGARVGELAESWLAAFGLEHARDAHPLDLPFVGRKRVALAATFAMGTPWLILDEPTLGQDAATMEALARMVAAHISHGGGAIIITHSVQFASLLQGRHLLLEGGLVRELA